MKLKRSEIAAIKRVAATVQPDLNKKYKKLKEIERLREEIKEIENNIAVWDQGIRNLTGVGVEELVEREVVNGQTRFKIKEDILEVEEQAEAQAEEPQEEQKAEQEQEQEPLNIF